MQLFWDITRVVTTMIALTTSGVCLSTWAQPMSVGQRVQFYALGALVATIGVFDFARLGDPPIVGWRLVTDPLIIGAALYGSWIRRRELPPPARQGRLPMFESRDRKLNSLIVAGYTVIGATLILQPDRYDNTPSYANLLDVLPAWWWGISYLVVAAGLAVSVRARYNRAAIVAAYTAAAALTAAWLAAFLVRWLTNTGTTVVNVVSWGTFLAVIVYSAIAQVDWGEAESADAAPDSPAPDTPTAERPEVR